MTQQHQVLSGRLSALISATGWFVQSSHEEDTTNQERFLHVLYVSQENQNPWIVIRKHSDFSTFSNSLESLNIQRLPPFPKSLSLSPSSSNNITDDLSDIAASSRNALQEWLDVILTLQKSVSTSTSSTMAGPLLQQFLCYGANLYSPEQVEGVQWVTFTNQEFFQISNNRGNNTSNNNNLNKVTGSGGNSARHPSIDEMDMDDMFDTSNYEHQDEDDESIGDDSEDERALKEYSAATRYQPFEEAISKEDAMEIQQQADEAEMVEDVGSLAQSLGASYLGKSLQLQAEMNTMKRKMEGQKDGGECKRQGGLYNTGSEKRMLGESTGSSGGIGGAVELADAQTPLRKSKAQATGDNLYQNPPVTPRLDSFKMIKVIGRGSFGKVTLVREIKTGEMYALKVLRKDNIIKRNQVEHTRTERSVLGYVKHPFIVGLKYAFQSKDKLYFVLDYCAGGELFFHLGKLGKFPEARTCFYTAQIVLAISYVHNLGIIYRDLKPENVLLDAKGHIRLTDFGLSKEGIVSSSTGAYSFCGTPEYLAPEILNRQGHGRAVDWWSLGALLYEMLSGLPPFYCRDREKLFEKIRKSELTYPRHLSAPAITVLRGLLTRDPKRRLGSGEKDAEEIKCQPFFSDISWTKLANGEIPPPWNPQLNNPLDTSQFDMEFTSMPIFSPATNQQHGGFGATPQENMFEGFSYTDRTLYRP